jgi:GT2 family glycosyltransferase
MVPQTFAEDIAAGSGYLMEKSRVLVVIVNARAATESLGTVEATLAALIGINGAVTIVDDGSDGASLTALSAALAARGWDRRVRVLEAGPFRGIPAGTNIGICAGLPEGQTPDYLYLLSPGVRPAPDAIRRLIAHLDANPRTGVVGGGLCGPDGAPALNAFHFPSLKSEFMGAAHGLPAADRGGPVDWVSAKHLMARRSAVDETGLFDEEYLVCFAEADLCRRARVAGWGTDHLPESAARLDRPFRGGEEVRRRLPGYWMDARLRYFLKNHSGFYAAAATVARVSGGLLSWLAVRPRCAEPPRFLRGLILHDAGFLMRSFWKLLRSALSGGSAPAPRQMHRR